MKNFKYKAKKGPNEIIEGVLPAESVDGAIDKVNELGLIPVDIWEDRAAPHVLPADAPVKKIKGIRAKDLLAFYRQTAQLVRSGVSVLQAIFLLSQQHENPSFKKILEELHRKIREGNSLSEALNAYPQIFTPFDVGMIQIGEASGKMDEVLSKVADYQHRQREIARKVRSAVAYPAFIFILGILTITFMLAYVIPQFAQFFADLGQDLPWITRVLLTLSEWTHGYWPAAAVCSVALIFVLRKAARNHAVRLSADAFLLKAPILGKVFLKSEIARLCRTLELLLRSGIPMLKALRIAVPVMQNCALRKELESSYRLLEEGGFLSQGLKNSKHFPSFVCCFVAIGEESGRLEETLREIADWYESDTEETVKTALSLMEPSLILIIGSVLALMIVAVLLPVFSINAMVQ